MKTQVHPKTWVEAVRCAESVLEKTNGKTHEAPQLVQGALKVTQNIFPSVSELKLYGDQKPFPPEASELLFQWLISRAEGIPLQHLLRYQYFYQHEYEVGPEALIPRPESEILVDEALKILKSIPGELLGAEIGVGSGILSTELLAKLEHLTMIGTDLSPEALRLAERNARRILGDKKIEMGAFQFLEVTDAKEVLEPVERFLGKDHQLDFILSNPPYLDPRSSDEVEEEVRKHEPFEALFAPVQDLLFFYKKIAESSLRILKENGRVFLELPHERAGEIENLFSSLGFRVKTRDDLNGRKRVLIAERGNERS